MRRRSRVRQGRRVTAGFLGVQGEGFYIKTLPRKIKQECLRNSANNSSRLTIDNHSPLAYYEQIGLYTSSCEKLTSIGGSRNGQIKT